MRIMMKKKGLGAPVVEPVVTGDPYWDNVVLLMHGDSAPAIDSSSRNLQIDSISGATISTTEKKFGSGSMLFATPSRYQTENSVVTSLSNSDFTIEAWVYSPGTQIQPYSRIIHHGPHWYDSNSWGLIYQDAYDPGKIGFAVYNYHTSGRLLIGSTPTSALNNTWCHLAVTRHGDTFRLFVNGIVDATNTWNGSIDNGDATVTALGGGFAAINSVEYFNGFIDDVRITKGVARYTENFTPPTSAFPNTRDTSVPLGADRTMLETFGPLRGISKVETNGLTDTNYDAKSIYVDPNYPFSKAAPWDGYKANPANYNTGALPVYDGITPTNAKRGRGYIHGTAGEINDQWWSVDMGKEVIVDSFSVYTHGGDAVGNTNLHPRNFRFETSTDGVTWTPVLTDVNQQWPPNDTVTRGSFHVLSTPVTSRYFRYFAIDNYGSTSWNLVSYIELYSIPDKTKTYTAIGNVQVGAAATMVSATTPHSGFYTLKNALQDTTVSPVVGGTYGPANFVSRVVVGLTIGATYTEVLDAGAGNQFVVGDITVQALDGTTESTDPFNVYVSDDNSSWTLAGQHITEKLGTINDDTTVPLSGVGRYLKLEVIPTYQISNYARLVLSHCTQWNIRIQEVN